MLIWQSHANADLKPAVAWAAEDTEPAPRIGLSRQGCWEVMGPVVRRPPQTGPKQPAGGIEEAPCCTNWPDSSDSSGEDWPMGTGISLQPQWNPLLFLTSSCKTPHSLTPQRHCLVIFTVFLLLRLTAGPEALFRKICSPCLAFTLNSSQDLVDPSLLTGTVTDCSCFLYSVTLWSSKNNKLTWCTAMLGATPRLQYFK